MYVQGMNTSHTNPTSDTTPHTPHTPHTPYAQATPFPLFSTSNVYPCNADTPLNELPRRLGLQSFAVVLEPLPHPAVFAQLRAALRLGRTRASLIADSLPVARSCSNPLASTPRHGHPTPQAHASTMSTDDGAAPRRPGTTRPTKVRVNRDPQRQFRFPTKAA